MAVIRLTTVQVLDERIEFSLSDVCRTCCISAETVIDMVAEGVVEPLGGGPDNWRFTGANLVRVQTALRLQNDLRVNLPGAALALELLEEIDELRRRVHRLSADWPD